MTLKERIKERIVKITDKDISDMATTVTCFIESKVNTMANLASQGVKQYSIHMLYIDGKNFDKLPCDSMVGVNIGKQYDGPIATKVYEWLQKQDLSAESYVTDYGHVFHIILTGIN